MAGKQARSKHAAGINAALHKALAHPLRGRIMVLLDETVASPKEISERLDEPLENVAYHVRELAKPLPLAEGGEAPLIELVAVDTRRGGTQHFYKATARPILDTEAWELLPRLIRELNSVWVGQIIIGDLIEALQARTFDARPGRTMLRMHLVLDEQGFEAIEPASRRWLEELQEIEAESTQRLTKSGETGINVATAALAYELPSTTDG
ncbi:MAG TPA: helix-turn-helix domain-containing protein [Solirubrobacterales bacterium]|nr:helix-turn-helix domain-containing protein [Solirubrobacterales bacterium]